MSGTIALVIVTASSSTTPSVLHGRPRLPSAPSAPCACCLTSRHSTMPLVTSSCGSAARAELPAHRARGPRPAGGQEGDAGGACDPDAVLELREESRGGRRGRAPEAARARTVAAQVSHARRSRPGAARDRSLDGDPRERRCRWGGAFIWLYPDFPMSFSENLGHRMWHGYPRSAQPASRLRAPEGKAQSGRASVASGCAPTGITGDDATA
jgi:hypothetical protein